MGSTISEVKSNWANAIVNADIDALSNIYANDAVLKPTLSNDVRRGFEEISPYFVGGEKYGDSGFLKKGISKVSYESSELHEFEAVVCETGIYHFTTPEGVVKAHFTFLFEKQPEGSWKIKTQHSSAFV